ncbi:MAG: hypothetical protein Q8L22_25120, partial [Reyranella sp.]|nr:hypothetical protein [Reyranella sp.]
MKAFLILAATLGAFMFYRPAILNWWRGWRAARTPTGKLAPNYVFGLAGGDRFVEGDLGKVLSAHEERIIKELEVRAHKLKAEMAPHD